MRKLYTALFLSAAFSGVTACGGGAGTDCDGSLTNTQCGSSGSAHSIVISWPITDAIINNGNGTYRRKGSVVVRDQLGRPVADGTRVELRMIDSIIVQGNTITGDTITGDTLSIPGAALADGTPVPDLTTAVINRAGAQDGQNRGIRAGDTVYVFNDADGRDRIRTVIARPTAANTLEVTRSYVESYPAYADASYIVGASMLGAGVAGEDESGKLTPGVVKTQGNEGVGTIWVTYPNKLASIMTGCAPYLDTRTVPLGAARTLLAANVGQAAALEDFCFAPIAGFTVIPYVDQVSISSGTSVDVTVCVQDGGDQVPVPFWPMDAWQSTGEAGGAVTLSSPYTGEGGCVIATLSATGNPDDTATFQFIAIGDAGAMAETTLTVR